VPWNGKQYGALPAVPNAAPQLRRAGSVIHPGIITGKYRARNNPVDHVAVSQPAFSFGSNTRPDNPLACPGKFLSEAG
jgi:hypothetical protein